jgi:hypothetical protein
MCIGLANQFLFATPEHTRNETIINETNTKAVAAASRIMRTQRVPILLVP